jgi:hypothetical protein
MVLPTGGTMKHIPALTDGLIRLELLERTADEATASRLEASRIVGYRLPVSKYERGCTRPRTRAALRARPG